MPSTDHYKIPLYTDEESPDLSTTGHYNQAMNIIDTAMNAQDETMDDMSVKIDGEIERAKGAEHALGERITQEVTARTDADTSLDTAYKAADTALGYRIDNAEAEISANSADLTGIKGLTYGAEHVQFLENNNGSYTSPALEEIAEQINSNNSSPSVVNFTTDLTISQDTLPQIEFSSEEGTAINAACANAISACAVFDCKEDSPAGTVSTTRVVQINCIRNRGGYCDLTSVAPFGTPEEIQSQTPYFRTYLDINTWDGGGAVKLDNMNLHKSLKSAKLTKLYTLNA